MRLKQLTPYLKTHRTPLIITGVILAVVVIFLVALGVFLALSGSSQQNHENFNENSDNLDKSNNSLTDGDLEAVSEAPTSGDLDTPAPPVTNSDPSWTNCTLDFGNLILINPNFTVTADFIASRQGQLISLSQTYGIPEYNPSGNGDNLMLPEAAAQLSVMISDYRAAYPGHEIGTFSCFRSQGTNCGRLCAATGTSDHHTGLTCDLIDLSYGSSLDTDTYPSHLDWQWLRQNSYKYGFIDRFPEAWAGGSMDEPLNVDGEGSTGLFETWHYRYVGVGPATAIATGAYNGGQYDSLEHYLKSTGYISDLKNGLCATST